MTQLNKTPLYPIDPAELHGKTNAKNGKTLSDQLFNAIRNKITSGEYQSGQRLASVRKLSISMQVSRDTVVRTYDKLTALGLVESRPSSGYFVCQPTRSHYQMNEKLYLDDQYSIHWWALLYNDLPFNNCPGTGTLPEDYLAISEISGALRTSIRTKYRDFIKYADPAGYLPLREQIQLKYSSMGVNVATTQVITTQGAQEATGLITHALFHERTNLAVVSPCNFMLTHQLLSRGMEIHHISSTEDEIDIEELRRVCQEYDIKALYLSSVLSNPLCCTLTAQQSFELLKLAEEFDFVIIDDLSYADLQPQSTYSHTLQLASMDQLNRVIIVGGFSKLLSPSLKVGYIIAAQKYIDRLYLFKGVQTMHSSIINENAVYQLLLSRDYQRICHRIVNKLAEKRAISAQRLESIGIKINMPQSGMYFWGDLGPNVDALKVQSEMFEKGFITAAGSLFSSYTNDNNKMRFNVAVKYSDTLLKALDSAIKSHALGK